MRTLDQSASSSSATIIGIEVITPCPISDLATMMVTVSSGAMRIQALRMRASIPLSAASPALHTCSRRPPPTAAPACRNRRREMLGGASIGDMAGACEDFARSVSSNIVHLEALVIS